MILATFVPGFFEMLIILSIALVINVLPLIAFWQICTKAGFPGPLALLMLVPIGNLVLLFYVAFAPWPALADREPPTAGVS